MSEEEDKVVPFNANARSVRKKPEKKLKKKDKDTEYDIERIMVDNQRKEKRLEEERLKKEQRKADYYRRTSRNAKNNKPPKK